jgi:hypothetical protein
MELFKFLKKKQVQSFELLLQKAADNPSYRAEFIKRLLTENFFIITNNKIGAEGLVKLEAGMNVNVFILKDGRVPIFTSTDRIFDKGIIKKEVQFLEAKGKDIFEFLKGASLILNPYSDYGKEFNPEEVERVLNGTYFNSRQIVIEKASEVRIGRPAKYPTEVVKSLVKLFSSKPDVSAAYVAWIHDPATPDPPHYIFAIKTTGDWGIISEEAGSLVQQILGYEEIVDFLHLKKEGFLNEYFNSEVQPFYKKVI